MRILVTGADGFVGTWVVGELDRAGHGVVRCGQVPASGDIERFDIRDLVMTKSAIQRVRPDALVHLAAQASPAKSVTQPFETFEVNVLGTVSVLESVRERPETRVLLVGSSHEYGEDCGDEPITEDAPLDPSSPYAVSKTVAEMIGRTYHKQFGLEVVTARSFNHTGPGQAPDYAVGAFCRGIVEIERGAAPKLHVGSLEPVRDFLDVRDVAAAYRILVEEGEPGQTYNVCSGQGRRIGDLLSTLLDLARLESVEISESGEGAGSPLVLVGDNSKIKGLGWKPDVSIDKSLADTLDWYRSQGNSGG